MAPAFLNLAPLPLRAPLGGSNRRPLARRAKAPLASASVSGARDGVSQQQQQPAPAARARKRMRAHVVDSRVASVVEAHHWITVKGSATRMFERAAVAQADMTRHVERRTGAGALHRWVLRNVQDPTLGFMDAAFVTKPTDTYVVMETFKSGEQDDVTHRWLSAVERVGPAVDTLDIQTRHYENVFTAKLHDAEFDPDRTIVVVESVNVDMSRPGNLEEVTGILRSGAEASVANGECLEFCILQAPGERGFFKTIEVYRDVDALRAHMDGLDRAFVRRTQGRCIVSSHGRSRESFKAVVFG